MAVVNNKPLIIFEMANNHMGDMSHAINIIETYGKLAKKYPFNFAFKLQYRHLDTFIHPGFKNRVDIKYIKRFIETRLSKKQFNTLIKTIRREGFLAISTPFDEQSVDLIDKQDLDYIKIASCSMTDWPLLERVSKSRKEVIVSTAGSNLKEIQSVVNFFKNRDIKINILQCVGKYPTKDNELNIGQIEFLKNTFPDLKIGFSTHETPDNFDAISIAISKGATILEKHVGLPNGTYSNNLYSASPDQVKKWLDKASDTYKMIGKIDARYNITKSETEVLKSLKRAIFVNKKIKKGTKINRSDVFFAIPSSPNSYLANDYSKYVSFIAKKNISENSSLTTENTSLINHRKELRKIVTRVNSIIDQSRITIPQNTCLEISHHYGLDIFNKYGLVMITVINKSYCKKYLLSLKGQSHPEQYHNVKEETFHILHGKLKLYLDGKARICNPGDVITVKKTVRHKWTAIEDCVIEEISSNHKADDSFYVDKKIHKNLNRKTLITHWFQK